MVQDFPIVAAGESNRGLRCSRNEDSFVLISYPGRNCIFAAVADGVGGNSRGRLASFICCRELCGAFLSGTGDRWSDRELAAGFLRSVIGEINAGIFKRNYIDHVERPMASTLIAMLCTADFAVIANIGDSRCYRYYAGALQQLTTDHVAPAGRSCKLPALSRAIGLRSRVDADIVTADRAAGVRFLLCTDGVYKMLDDACLAQLMRDSRTPRAAVSQIVRTTLINGARDNLTAITLFSTDGVS